MVKEIICYTVICDRCGKDSAAEDEYCGYNDESYSLDCAADSGFVEQGSKHYCPDCYFYDDDDNLVIKPK